MRARQLSSYPSKTVKNCQAALTSGQERNTAQPRCLWQTEHQIHALNSLTGSAFHQIINHRQHHDCVAVLRAVQCNTTGVTAAHRARLWQASQRHDIDKRRVGVAFFKQELQFIQTDIRELL